MALFFDPPSNGLSPNGLALAFITNFQGSYTMENQTIGGFNVTKVTYHKSSNTFAAARIEAIANDLSSNVFLSQKGPDFEVTGTDGITRELREVAGATLNGSVGQILVWDTSDCDGEGRHVFDTAGNPIKQEMFHTVFHELSHAYHRAIGTNFSNEAHSEALATHETNLLRAEIGMLEMRDPSNHAGGCGPGPQKPWWHKFTLEFVVPLGTFVGGLPAPTPNIPSPSRIGELIQKELDQIAGFASTGTFNDPAFRNQLEGPILQRIRAFYRCAALVLHSDKCRATLPAELALELSRSSGDTLTLPLTTALATPMDAVTAFLTDPCRIIGEAHAAARSQQVAVSEIATTFTDSVKEWYEKVQRYSIDGAASDGQYHSELGVGATLINPLRRDSVTGA